MNPLSRRRLLRATARSAAAITVFAAAPACAFNPLPALPGRGMPSAESSAAWLRRTADGRIQLHLPRQEMGQGVAVALRQIVAEELGVDLQQVEAVPLVTDAIDPVRATVGSDSMRDFARPVARAAALLREHLAAGMAGSEIADTGQPVVLRSLAAGNSHSHVGTSPPMGDIHAIVTGAPLYAADIGLPGLLHGLVLHDAPAVAGDAGVQVVGLSGSRQGLLAEHPGLLHARYNGLAHQPGAAGDAEKGAGVIPAALDIDRLLAGGRLEHGLQRDRIETSGKWSLDRRYEIPFAAHAQIEPRAAVARWHDSGPVRLEIWTGTQDAFFVRDTLARHFGLSADAVVVRSCRIGGAFGGRTIVRQELEAAELAQAAGRPVKVQWTRADEFRHGFCRPPSSHRIRARLDADGRIADWWHAFASGHVIFTSAAMPRWMQVVTSFVKDPGVARGALPPYAAARRRVEFADVRLPVDTGPWRGLGAAPNCYVIESAIDELAGLAGRDPLQFRLDNLDPAHDRLAACLRHVAGMADWGKRPRAGAGSGRGIACGIYKETSFAATVADVEAGADGQVRVTRLYCAHDCGQVINPGQVRAQVEGNLLWALGMVLHEQVPIEHDRVAAYTFADYPIPTMDSMPQIEIALIDTGVAPPTGAGETALVTAAAIGNAIASATGRRLTRLPYRPGV